MNWYKLYIGDYRRKTAHLSLSEHGAYKILLDHYYATGEPLPHDVTALCRIVSAQTDEERQAVSRVAEEFFPPNGDGRRHNKRADEELSQYAETVEHNRRVGRLGGRPRKPGNNPSGFENETRNKPEWVPGNNPNQKLETRSQNTEVQIPEKTNTLSSLRSTAREVLEFLNTKTGKNFQPVPANLDLIIARLKEGATLRDCRQVIARKMIDWETDPEMQKYLRPATLFNRTKFANYIGELKDETVPEMQ